MHSEGWTVPWQGRSTHLTVESDPDGPRLSVRLDGAEVASLARPTRREPWAECSLPGSPAIKVVQLAHPHGIFETIVFVDGISLVDGQKEARLKANPPQPMDAFESEFGTSRVFGRWGAVGLGVFASLAFLSGHDSSVVSVGLAIAAGCLVAGWVLLNGRFVQWLVDQRDSPSAGRRLVLALTLLGTPFLAVLVIRALALPH